MERIVIFGKGGIGKSTVATCISASLAAQGKRVLHVGCDPKHDSTVALLGGRMIAPVVDRIEQVRGVTAAEIVTRSHLGVDCVEAGGPSAGVGCGGRGITRMLEIFHEAELLSPAAYDVVLYDVLGDVVCGGFAAPLRRGVGEKVVIVASEELMALYAANNIAKAVVHYATNGIQLAGIVFNLKDIGADRAMLERFAAYIGAPILGWIERDPLVRDAEYRRMTVVEHAPASAIARRYGKLADDLLAVDPATLSLPSPLSEVAFYDLAQRKFHGRVDGASPAGAVRTADGAATSPTSPTPAAVPPRAGDERSMAEAFAAELRQGGRAVRLGLVSVDEALARLRGAFPVHAQALGPQDLLS